MSESEFIERWESERAFYGAWGRFISAEIHQALTASLRSISVETFIKIEPVPRLKQRDSLLRKAFYSGKGYANPYDEIEDKVGLRFVVLLTSDIRKIQDVIEASRSWTSSLDRDFEAERAAKPHEFAYQSKHYVLRAAHEFNIEGAVIPKGTPCEVQLRTLLQHAHSELTHDNIYKRESTTPVSNGVQRAVAKSMALIEAVDDYFVQATSDLQAATQTERNAINEMLDIYSSRVELAPTEDKSFAVILGVYRQEIEEDSPAHRIGKFLDKYPFVLERVRDRAARIFLYRQPWILLIYSLIPSAPEKTAAAWPFTPEELRPLFNDLGIRFPG